MKKCIKCGEVKPLEMFHKHSQMKDGHLNKCSDCVVKDVAEWRLKNPDCRKKEHARVREREGYMSLAEWRDHQKKHSIGRKASSIKYFYKRRLQQVFKSEWDEFVFEEAIRLSVLREKVTGFKWHVDHIVPLNHKHACGLHVASNFQVVPASWNVKKGNRNMAVFNPSGY